MRLCRSEFGDARTRRRAASPSTARRHARRRAPDGLRCIDAAATAGATRLDRSRARSAATCFAAFHNQPADPGRRCHRTGAARRLRRLGFALSRHGARWRHRRGNAARGLRRGRLRSSGRRPGPGPAGIHTHDLVLSRRRRHDAAHRGRTRQAAPAPRRSRRRLGALRRAHGGADRDLPHRERLRQQPARHSGHRRARDPGLRRLSRSVGRAASCWMH